ncbi:alsin-like isoform X1, partial [Paramuricea clavata]
TAMMHRLSLLLSSETVNTKVGSFTPAKARYASHFYLQDPKYKGACYTGMWLSGKPHGHGKLVWASTAQTYEGEFRNGLYNGFGRMIFVLNASAGVAEEYKGEWKDGMMHGQGEMSYSDKQVYIGHWMHNVRHGHGVLRMGTMTSPTPSIFTGNWDNDKRSGFGVMDDIMRGEKYMGMWDNDARSGNGLIVTLDGIYNEGRFSLNKLMGQGILLCHDNTKFEGDFCGDAQVNGKGVLTMPNGDRIEGTFQGQWNEGLKINGLYFKGTGPEENSAVAFPDSRAVSTHSPYYIPATKKWRSVFNECRDRLGCLGNDEPDLKKAWKSVAEDLVRAPVAKTMHQEREIIDDILKGVDLDQAKKIAKDKKKLQEYLIKAFSLPCHPLGRLLETLVDVYRATYVGMGAHSRLLPHAVEEIKSYIERVYAIIRILFPSLPNEDFVHVGDSNEADGQSEGGGLDSNTLLGPLIFPRFYPPLFTLYALHNEKNDSAYWERVLQLNKRTDLALMSYLEVKRTFWLASEETNGLVYEADLTDWKHTHYYGKAVDAFQQISTKFSPMEKISVLKETFHRIHKEVQDFWKGEEKIVSLDDLFPVFQFVVIRSRVHHLGSEIDFIEDLMEAKYRAGEQGHMFTTLKACYYQILNEN